MVLVYMLTSRGYIDGIHVTIYSSTMDPMGMDKSYIDGYINPIWIPIYIYIDNSIDG